MQEDIQTAQKIVDIVIDFFVSYSFQVAGAIVILIAGWLIAKSIASFLSDFMIKKGFEVTLSKFIGSTLKFIIIGFAVLIAFGKFGITVAPFIAALAAMAFGASLAIQGPLSNYGSGLAIILTRPFIVGNTISVVGVSGVVEEVKLGATILTDEDGVKITIPNKHIMGEIIRNSDNSRIVEEVVGISYSSSPEKAIHIAMETLGQIEEVSSEPPPQVGIQKFGDSSIEIGLRYSVPSRKYFDTLYKVNLSIFKNLKQGGIEIPFPQREVRIISET